MNFWWLVMLTVMNHVSYRGVRVLVSLDAIHLGASPMVIGVLFSLFSVFPAVLAVVAGRISDRYGARWPMLFGSTGLALGLLLCFARPGLATLYVATTLIGACYIFYIVAGQHLVGAWGGAEDRTRNFSYYSLGNGLTALIGPTLAGFLIDEVGHHYTYLVLAVLPLVPITFLVFAGRRLPATQHGEKKAQGSHYLDLLRRPPLVRLLLVSGIIETGMELFNFYMPIYANSVGLSATRIGIIMGAYGGAMLVARSVLPYWMRRTSEERVLTMTMALAAGAAVGMPFVQSFALLIVLSCVLGLGLGSCTPLAMVLTYNRAPEGRTGEAMGLRQTFNKFTEVLVPIVFGTIGSAFGVGPAFWFNAVLMSGGVAIMSGEARARAKPKAT
jgi:MFS family permease